MQNMIKKLHKNKKSVNIENVKAGDESDCFLMDYTSERSLKNYRDFLRFLIYGNLEDEVEVLEASDVEFLALDNTQEEKDVLETTD